MDRKVSPEVMDNFFIANAKDLFSLAKPITTEELFDRLMEEGRLIKYATGAKGFFSHPKARPTEDTRNTLDYEFTEKDLNRFQNAFGSLKLIREQLYRISLIGGEGDYKYLIHYLAPASMFETMWSYSKIMRPAAPEESQEVRGEIYQIRTPGEIEAAQAIKAGVNLAMGGNYIGIDKKSIFSDWLYLNNETLNGFGMHGGYKKVTIDGPDKTRNYVIIIIGGSGHGKSTLSFSNYGLNNQMDTLFGGDDMVSIVYDEKFGFRILGWETLGLYLKVIGTSPTNEPLSYEGAMGPNAILENVPMDNNGNPRFDLESESILGTSNHRAVVPLRHFTQGKPPALNVPLDDDTEVIIMLLCRTPEHPTIVRHNTPEHAVAFFGALPTVKTSAEKAGAKGKEVRLTCGADPFTPGGSGRKLQKCYEMFKKLGRKLTVISVNTSPEKYKLEVTEKSIRSVLTGTAEWIELPSFPGRSFLKDPLMKYDPHFERFFGELCVMKQKVKLREIGAPKEVIDAL